jgi:DNA-binding transcriptional LysR family regulator
MPRNPDFLAVYDHSGPTSDASVTAMVDHPFAQGGCVDLLGDMRIFVWVARFSSFSAAAKELQLSLSNVSKRVARLEGYLNAVLFQRTTRQVELTDAGIVFFRRCAPLIKGVDEAVQSVTDSNLAPEGHLRIHALHEIGKRHLIPAIAEFSRTYPAVTFDLVLGNKPPRQDDHFDVYVSLAPPADSSLISRNIGASYSVLCASPQYLARRGQPTVPEELSGHECLRPLEDATHSADSWDFEGPYGEVSVYLPPSAFQLNSSDAMLDAVRSGLGIGCIPAFVAAPYLRDKQVVRVLPRYQLESSGIYVSYSAAASGDAHVRSWVAYLSARFAQRHGVLTAATEVV